jgi:MFS family permease
MDPARRQIVLINAAHFWTHYSLLILPTSVLVMARPGGAFGTDYGAILALATGMFVLYGAFSLPQGWLAGRFGRKNLLAAFYFGTGAALAGAGTAAGPWSLAAWLALAGLFAAIYHPIGTAMLVEAAGDRPGRSIGVNGVFGNVGVASAPVVTGLLAAQFSWRAAFIVPGLLCFALGFLWRHTPPLDAHARARVAAFPPIPRAMVRRAVVVLLVIAAVSGLVFNAFTLLLPKLMQERLAGSGPLLPLVGAAAFAATLCGALTQFSVGRLIDRMTLRRVFLPMSMVLAPALAALAFARGPAVLLLAGLAAAVIFGQVTVNETMTARYIAPSVRARMYSVRFFIGFLGSAAAAPMVGWLHDSTGSVAAPLLVLAVCALAMLGCALWFPERREELMPELWTAPAGASILPGVVPGVAAE